MAPFGNTPQDASVEGSYQASQDGLPKPTTYGGASDALGKLTALDTLSGKAEDTYSIYKLQAQDKKRLTPKEANALYPGMQTPFRQDVAPSVAKYMYDRELEKYKLSEAAANGPQDTWSKTKYMGVGLWAHATDPYEVAANVLGAVATGGLIGAGALGAGLGEAAATISTANKLKKAARLGQISSAAARAGQASLGAKVAVLAAEGAGAGAAFGVAQGIAESGNAAARGEDYDIAVGALNVGEQALIGGVFGAATPLVGKAFKWAFNKVDVPVNALELADIESRDLARRINEMSPDATVALVRTAIADASEMRVTNPKNLMDALSQETSVRAADFEGKGSFEYVPLQGTAPKGTKVFVVADSANFEDSARGFTSDPMGNQLHASTDPYKVNAAGVRSMNEARGVIHEGTIADDAKLFNIDRPFGDTNTKEAAVFARALELTGEANPTALLSEAGSPKNVIDYLHDVGNVEAIESYQKGLRELGYDVLHSEGTVRNGAAHEPHNAMMFLDESKFVPERHFTPDTDVVRPPNQEMLAAETAARQGIEGRLDIDTKKLSKFMEDAESIKFDPKQFLSDLERSNKDALENLKALVDQGDLNVADRAVYERLQALDNTIKDERTLTKAALGCLTGIL